MKTVSITIELTGTDKLDFYKEQFEFMVKWNFMCKLNRFPIRDMNISTNVIKLNVDKVIVEPVNITYAKVKKPAGKEVFDFDL